MTIDILPDSKQGRWQNQGPLVFTESGDHLKAPEQLLGNHSHIFPGGGGRP